VCVLYLIVCALPHWVCNTECVCVCVCAVPVLWRPRSCRSHMLCYTRSRLSCCCSKRSHASFLMRGSVVWPISTCMDLRLEACWPCAVRGWRPPFWPTVNCFLPLCQRRFCTWTLTQADEVPVLSNACTPVSAGAKAGEAPVLGRQPPFPARHAAACCLH